MTTSDANVMVYVKGAKYAFKCEDCGSNVFHKVQTERGERFECNGCPALYEGGHDEKDAST